MWLLVWLVSFLTAHCRGTPIWFLAVRDCLPFSEKKKENGFFFKKKQKWKLRDGLKACSA